MIMESKPEISLGPFFIRDGSSQGSSCEVLPLKLAVEWANADQAVRIPLFRRLLKHAPDRIRLEHIVFRRRDLPCDMECQENQVSETFEGTFLPLDALLAARYGAGTISRPVFSVLNELAALVPLQETVTNRITQTGLLLAEADKRGFRLNAVFQEAGLFYAQIGWEPDCLPTRLHVCLASFRPGSAQNLQEVQWMLGHEVGISEVLSGELRRLVPGNAIDLFSQAGADFLATRFLRFPQATAPHS
jgi:hypothetical protein